MRVIDLENINYAMRSETQFVLRCEEVFHDKISAAATTILSNKGEKPLVALTGPSGSGKTTTAMRLQEYLQNLGVHVCLLSMDNFFLPLDQRPPEATDWESPYCVNVEQLVSCISQLADGKEADIPWYDFKEGKTGGYRKMQGDKDGIDALEKKLLAQNAQHKDWACTEEMMKLTKDGKALYLHCLPADITGLSCAEGEVDNSVFDRYIVPLYKQASYKPYIIAAMIFLAQVMLGYNDGSSLGNPEQ